jgi:hypothetical protein
MVQLPGCVKKQNTQVLIREAYQIPRPSRHLHHGGTEIRRRGCVKTHPLAAYPGLTQRMECRGCAFTQHLLESAGCVRACWMDRAPCQVFTQILDWRQPRLFQRQPSVSQSGSCVNLLSRTPCLRVSVVNQRCPLDILAQHGYLRCITLNDKAWHEPGSELRTAG